MVRSVLACLAAALVAPAVADTIVIGPTGPYTIQQAIDLAADGDVVELLDGVYAGSGNRDLEFHGKAITVRSQSGNPAACTIDCQGSNQAYHRGFIFLDDEGLDSIVEGVTVTGGHADGDGGGMACLLGYPTVRNCRFVDNWASGDGGGLKTGGPTVVEDCWFAGNEAMGGGGAATTVAFDVTAVFARCTFVDNVALGYGGGHRT
ncbi:MAG TPA: hypothetical protein PLL30_00665 [Candidatus Krumholzibacteria bacterium]|nr:hypothetical protein [Candidatus Krumholzibacteria bacterium]HPD70272.1 hypothetical protein [Candidatus Krumholzibacteria bacterium]HRY40028.1 hypothetical protein [Candidatus Krumholzibacteria bacterium]